MLISLNSNSAHLELLLNNKLDFNNLVVVFNGLRFLIPFLIFPILIFIYIYKFRSVISKKNPLLFFILLSNFIFQIVIYKINYVQFDIGYVQLALNCISFLLLYILSNSYDLSFFSKYFFSFVFFLLFFIAIFFAIKIYYAAIDSQAFYFYSSTSLKPTDQFIGQPNPRVTGISKILVIYFIFHFFLFYRNPKNKNVTFLNFFVLFIIIYLVYGMQTRGALAEYFIFIHLFIFC